MINKTGIIPLLLTPILSILFIPGLMFALILNEIVRFIVSKLLYIQYKNKINLLPDSSDGIFGFKKEGSTRNVIVYVVTEGRKLDANRIARFYTNKIQSFVDPLSGARPYEKFEKILTTKYGYFCWEDTSETFDVRNHIRVMNKKKLYSQTDLCKLNSEFIKDMDESKPQWEIIIFPRYDDGTGTERSILMVRFQHGFMDGVSFVMLFKEHLSLESNYSIDPLNFRIPLWKKVLFYISSFIYGPFSAATTLVEKLFLKTWIPRNANLPRTKHFTASKPISSESIRQIRQNTGKASVSNVISTAFVKSATNVLPRDRLVSEILISELLAFLPYPNSHPQNRVGYFTYGLSTDEVDGINDNDHLDKIRKCKQDCLRSQLGPEPLMIYYAMKIWGRFPSIFTLFLTGTNTTVLLSNVPFSKSKCTLTDGTEVLDAGAWTPHIDDLGISVTTISYGDGIKICGCADSSWLSREELCQIIDGIPKEIETMVKLCTTSSISKVDGIDKIVPNYPNTLNGLRSR